MTSWRETTTQQTQDDFDDLLHTALPFAERSLSERGEFFPFGAVITVDGELRTTAAHLGDEHPQSTDVLEALYEATRSDGGALRAAAFVADVRTADGDAIRIDLEASEKASIRILVPYKRNRLTKRPALGAMSVHPGEGHVWQA